MNIDKKLLEKQMTAILESNLSQEIKSGIHNLLGEILDKGDEEDETEITYRGDDGLWELFDNLTNVSYWLDNNLRLVRVTRR